MNTDLHQAATQYIGVIGDEIVCHTGVIQFPMRKGWKRVHRLVVLPDYQGIGIGTKFITKIAEMYHEQGMEFNLTTTTPALVGALRKHPNWLLLRYGREKTDHAAFARYGKQYSHLNNSRSNSRITYSFFYKEG